MIDVAEIYTAPQGEGPTLGRPSLFVRVRGCPLACRWCDSKFTWNPPLWKTPAEGLTRIPPKELATHMFKIAQYGSHFPSRVIFTGGEPLIYQRALPIVIHLYRHWAPHHITFEVETAGTIIPSKQMLRDCRFNVSPKLQSAGNERIPLTTLWNWKATQAYLQASPANVFKLVVDLGDEVSLESYLAWLKDCAADIGIVWQHVRSRIYLMPAAITVGELVVRQARIIDLATQHGVNVTTRLHILAYGNERGR